VVSGLILKQVAEERPSAAFLLPKGRSFVVAAYPEVRLTLQDFRSSREWDFARLNLHLVLYSNLQKMTFSAALRFLLCFWDLVRLRLHVGT